MNKRESNATLFFAIISLLMIVIIVLLQFNMSVGNSFENSTKQTLENVAKQQKQSFDRELTSESNGLASIVKAISAFEYYDQDAIIEYIEQVQSNFNFQSIVLADATAGGGLLIPGEHLVNISEEPYYDLVKQGQTVTTEPHISDHSGDVVLTVAAPIYYEGTVQAMITAEYSTDYLASILHNDVLNAGGYAMIVNQDGDILLSTVELGYDYVRTELVQYDPPNTSTSVSDDIRYGRENVVTFELDGNRSISAYTPLAFNNWSIMYVVPEDTVMQLANSFSNQMTTITMLVTIAFLSFATYILYTKRKSLLAIEKTAYYDELTGIRNLSKFKIDVAQVLSQNPNKQYYMVKADVINFKAINELFSFETGNRVIITMAEAGKQASHPSFIQARVTSDEFMLFAEKVYFDNIGSILDRYTAIFKEKLAETALNHRFEFRVGRYLIEQDETDIDSMINKTNMAHSFAKVEGGACIWDYDERFKQQVLKNGEITNKMHSSLENGHFKAYLQPKNSVETGEVLGAEALVRWIEPDGKVHFPGDFIPLFERNGFITKLDMYMLETVCKMLRRWQDEGKKCIPISVNFSRINLNDPNFVSKIKAIADKHGVPTKFIEVELTETSLSDDEKQLTTLLDSLKEAEFSVSIDDFGSGYSTLGMLKNFKVDTLKLDRSFFIDYRDDKRGNLVVEGIIKLARSLDMFTLAEGIEEKGQVEFLHSVGCDAAQGYYFAKPMPISDFEKKLFGDN